MRLERFVSHALGLPRRRARELILSGEIAVDGEVERRPAARVGPGATVNCRGEDVAPPGHLYLMLHKPCGLISATRDDRQATVLSLLPEALARRVHPVGRLDKDTSGLLLLTSDGDWSHRVSSPRHACRKVYRATLAEPLVNDAEVRLAHGLVLRNEARPTRPATLQRLAPDAVLIGVTEGRYHLVRRLFAALGNRVTTLHREQVGGLVLDVALQPGEWRHLDADEVRRVLTSSE
ncbi:MAG: pseudouridine synthase [Gammaproteobacteria bacterium]|nr:pseudouridine synthase [Gammaproteobacteria bacterium]